jgi:hypothetical protein
MHLIKPNIHKMRKLLLTAVLGTSVLMATANDPLIRKCASNDILQQQLADDPARAAVLQQIENQTAAYIIEQQKNHGNSTQAIVTIPVVFHVIYNTSAQNISDAKCIAQLDQLNLDYARMNSDAGNTPAAFAGLASNTQIQFCLAQRDPSGLATTGVIHKSTSTTSFSSNDNVKKNNTGGDAAWDATKYLNIWTCNLGQGLLGYAQFPGGSATTDGVVVLYSSVGSMLSPGTAAPYHYGRTATHEVGHWLNLRHIWGDESQCNADDLVSDTPKQKGENYGCPTYPQTTQAGGRCSTGDPSSMYMNYMDYTDDACMNMFSAGQASRMQALFTSSGARFSITTSLGCTPPSGQTCNAVTGLTSSSVTSTSATLSWTAAAGALSYNIQYRIVGTTGWTSTTSTTTSKAISGLTASSNYEWQVQTVCSSGSSAFTSSAIFNTSAPSCNTPTGATAGSINTTQATISWSAASGAVTYNLNWKISTSGVYTTISGITNTSYVLTGLTSCTAYNYQVQTVCSSGSSAFSNAGTFTTSGCAVSYCASQGTNTSYEYINKVVLGSINNTSGANSGYGNYTALSTNLAGSTSNTITLTPGFAGSSYREYWKVYIDYNKNGVFTDAGENVVSTNSTAAVSAFFTVPASALNGSTRMRVQMQYNAYATSSCGSYTYGEVEDYSVVITGNAQRPMADLSTTGTFETFSLYPNPSSGMVNVSFDAATSGTATLRVSDIVGKIIVTEHLQINEGFNKFTVDLTPYTKGIYFMELSDDSNRSLQRLILDK